MNSIVSRIGSKFKFVYNEEYMQHRAAIGLVGGSFVGGVITGDVHDTASNIAFPLFCGYFGLISFAMPIIPVGLAGSYGVAQSGVYVGKHIEKYKTTKREQKD